MKIKVMIADDHPVVAQGIQRMLEAHGDIEVCGVFRSGELLLKHIQHQQPDVLLLDIQMPGKQGDELAQIIAQSWPGISILALTNLNQPFHVRNMLHSGAKGYLLKSAEQEVLVEAIRAVFEGKQYIDDSMKEQMFQEMLETRAKNNAIPALTQREQEILELIASEYTSQEIAKKLFISLSTVENHRLNILFKLGVKNAAGLVRKAIQLGLIK